MRRQNQAFAGVEEDTEEIKRPDNAPQQNVYIQNHSIALNVKITEGIKSEIKSEHSNNVSSDSRSQD